jgi:hypothetical protein
MTPKRLLQTLAVATAVGMVSPVYAQADNTNSKSFPGWMSDYSKTNEGRISRQAYMDEAGRRWDAMDRTNRGLTLDEVNRAYGYANPGAPTMNKDTAPPANQGGPGAVKK